MYICELMFLTDGHSTLSAADLVDKNVPTCFREEMLFIKIFLYDGKMQRMRQ